MSSLTINLPESLADRLKDSAEKDKVNPEQFVVIALAEKLASLATLDYLETRAKLANLDGFEKILAKIPDVEPEEFDKIQ